MSEMKKGLVVGLIIFVVSISLMFFVLAENNTSSGGGGSSGNLTQYNGTVGNVINTTNGTNDSSSSGGGIGGGGANCTDSDGGVVVQIQGTTVGYNSSGLRTQTDRCSSTTGIYEFFCQNNQIEVATLSCPTGFFCSNGACNISGGNNGTNGTNGTGTPRGENNTGQMYDEVITCVFRETNQRQSCYIASETGYYGCTGLGSCRVSVGDYYGALTWKSSCGEYQYTTTDGRDETITFQCNITGTEGGGNGSGSTNGSGDARGATGTEESGQANEEGKRVSSLTCESGCPSGDTCYPIGYRKGGNYCTDAGEFVKQIPGESACENNFECSSNVCVSNQCISESFIQKILNWFRNLFGN